jgi:hypothetical protein
MMAGEGFAEGVERAGADVAEDDTDRAQREAREALIAMAVRLSAQGRLERIGILLDGGAGCH